MLHIIALALLLVNNTLFCAPERKSTSKGLFGEQLTVKNSVVKFHDKPSAAPIESTAIENPIVRTEGTGCNGPWISYTQGSANGTISATYFSTTLSYVGSRNIMNPDGSTSWCALENANKVYNDLQMEWKARQQKLSTSQNLAQKPKPNTTESATIKK